GSLINLDVDMPSCQQPRTFRHVVVKKQNLDTDDITNTKEYAMLLAIRISQRTNILILQKTGYLEKQCPPIYNLPKVPKCQYKNRTCDPIVGMKLKRELQGSHVIIYMRGQERNTMIGGGGGGDFCAYKLGFMANFVSLHHLTSNKGLTVTELVNIMISGNKLTRIQNLLITASTHVPHNHFQVVTRIKSVILSQRKRKKRRSISVCVCTTLDQERFSWSLAWKEEQDLEPVASPSHVLKDGEKNCFVSFPLNILLPPLYQTNRLGMQGRRQYTISQKFILLSKRIQIGRFIHNYYIIILAELNITHIEVNISCQIMNCL
ncbi:hypothetical protein ACJX0J_011940, partial [Zea mays]